MSTKFELRNLGNNICVGGSYMASISGQYLGADQMGNNIWGSYMVSISGQPIREYFGADQVRNFQTYPEAERWLLTALQRISHVCGVLHPITTVPAGPGARKQRKARGRGGLKNVNPTRS